MCVPFQHVSFFSLVDILMRLLMQVPVETCDYMLDLDFPEHPVEAPHEPRYAVQSETWERTYCAPFLDARHSPLLTRTLWLPGSIWQDANSYGDYCLLKHKKNVAEKERIMIELHSKP